MPALELLSQIMGVDVKKLSKQENLILEAELYTHVFHKRWQMYKREHKDYFNLLKCNMKMESMMLDLYVIQCLINDILKSESYTLSGIASYTETSLDLIQELLVSQQMSEMMAFPRKLIELHKSVRPELYQDILKKVLLVEAGY